MAIQAEQRYRTVEAFLSDLEGVLGTSLQFTIRPERSPAVPDDHHPQRKLVIQWKLVMAIVGSIVLVCGIGTVAAYLAGVFNEPASRSPPVPPEGAPVQPRTASLEQPNIQQPSVVPLAVPTQPSNPPVLTQPSNPPVPTQPPNPPVPAQPPPTPPRASSISSMRIYVRQAAQYQVHLMQILLQIRESLNTINKQRAISPQALLKVEESTYNSLQKDKDKYNDLDKYMAQIAWLGANDDASVKAAVKLERDVANKPTVNKQDAAFNAQISSAIDLLAVHLRQYRQGHLTRDAIIADVSSSIDKPPQPGPRKKPPQPGPRPAPSDTSLDAIIQELLKRPNSQ